jgi:hypothetical protein
LDALEAFEFPAFPGRHSQTRNGAAGERWTARTALRLRIDTWEEIAGAIPTAG